MDLILPKEEKKDHELKIGDIVVHKDGATHLIAYDAENDAVHVVLLDGSDMSHISSDNKTVEDWKNYWDRYFPGYKIYSKDEWDLKLVPKFGNDQQLTINISNNFDADKFVKELTDRLKTQKQQ